MPRAIWSGSLSFGLVNVPVRLFAAIDQKDIHFHQFQAGTGARVRNMRVVEGTHDEVGYEDVVKGYELDDGRYVMLTQDELESVEPGRSRTIDIEDFVDLADIDPLYFEKTYYLAPAPDAGADKPYALLLRAMEDAQRVAVARFVMRGKQYLTAIRPMGTVLALETMYFPDEVRDAQDLDGVPVRTDIAKRELDAAARLIDSLTTTWDPDRYHDTYRERVLELIDRKASGERVEVHPAAESDERVVDLLAALEASLERRSSGQRGKEAGRSENARRRPGNRSSRRAQPTAGAEAPTGRAGRRPGPHDTDDGDGLGELTRGQLMERARAADVPGRSKMSKGDLVAALAARADGAREVRRAG